MDGPDLIVFGSSTLTSVLFDHGLVDEVVLSRRASTVRGLTNPDETVSTAAPPSDDPRKRTAPIVIASSLCYA